MICITSSNREATETKILSLGAEDYIVKPFSKDVVRARIDTHVKLKVYRDRLTGMIDEGVSKLEHIHNSVLLTLANVTEYRNLESGDHIRRTQQMTAVLMSAISGQEWFLQKYGNENIGAIVRVSVLHDIGKIGIRDDIILKPGRLTSGEFAEIKRHAEIGEKIAEQFFPDGAGFVRYCKQICRSHHERWDGGGYPDGLKGEEIPLSARVVAIVDVLDTLVSDRVYKKAISFDEAIGIIEGERGRQFDPVLVDAALGVRSELENICRSVK